MSAWSPHVMTATLVSCAESIFALHLPTLSMIPSTFPSLSSQGYDTRI
jgi:hypothetical protein